MSVQFSRSVRAFRASMRPQIKAS